MAPAVSIPQPTTTEAFPDWVLPVSIISGLVIVVPLLLIVGIMLGLSIRDHIFHRRQRRQRAQPQPGRHLHTANRRSSNITTTASSSAAASSTTSLPAGVSEVILPERVLRDLQRARAAEAWGRDEPRRARGAERRAAWEAALRAEAQRVYGDVLGGAAPRPIVELVTPEGVRVVEVVRRPREPLPPYAAECFVAEPLPAYAP